MVEGESWLWYDSVFRSMEGAFLLPCGWWCCIEARSAKVSIPVDGCLEGGRSVTGAAPFPPLGLEATGEPVDVGDDSDIEAGTYTCCARGEDTLPLRPGPDRVRWRALWGEDDGAGVGAGELFDEGPGTGVEFPDCGFESGESSELISMLSDSKSTTHSGEIEGATEISKICQGPEVTDSARIAEIQIRRQPRYVLTTHPFLHRPTELGIQIPSRLAGLRNL